MTIIISNSCINKPKTFISKFTLIRIHKRSIFVTLLTRSPLPLSFNNSKLSLLTSKLILAPSCYPIIFVRFYPGGGGNKPPFGHVHKVLTLAGSAPKPPVILPSQGNPYTMQGSNIVSSKKPVEADPMTLHDTSKEPITQPSLFDTAYPQPIDNLSIYDKMKQTALKIIPSTRPRNLNIDNKTVATTADNMTLQGKEAIAFFLNYFPNLPEEFVKDSRFLAMFHKCLTENHSEVLVRAYQLCLEYSYSKKTFSEQELRDIFENKFSIIDLFEKNNGITDTSTLFSALQANHLHNQPGFAKAVDLCVVIATSPTTGNLKHLNPKLAKKIEDITKATGNTINDIDLNGHPYDFKLVNDPYYAKNHVMFISPDQNKIQFDFITKKMLHPINEQIRSIQKLQYATPYDIQKRLYYEELQKTILNIQQSDASNIEKFLQLNIFVFNTLHTRPRDIYIPLFVPILKQNFEPHPSLSEKVQEITLPSIKTIQSPSIRKAILEPASKWDLNTKRKASQDTDGVLSFEDTI